MKISKFIDLEGLKQAGYSASIPMYYRSRVGVIRNVPVDITAEEIYDEISQKENILKIERMTRRLRNGHRDYSLNVKITFNCAVLPTCVSIYHGLERVFPYIAPVLQCMGCLRYGHHVNACKTPNQTICKRCGSKDHDTCDCIASRPSCIHCKKEHEATAKDCMERKRQENIKILMSGKNLSYKEVLEQFPQYCSNNQFNILENMDDFPSLNRQSYRDQLKGKRSKTVYRNEKKRQVYPKKQADVNSQHYSQFSQAFEPTTPMTENKNRVSEYEREETFLKANQNQSKFANNDSVNEIMDESTSSESELIINTSLQLEEQQFDNNKTIIN